MIIVWFTYLATMLKIHAKKPFFFGSILFRLVEGNLFPFMPLTPLLPLTPFFPFVEPFVPGLDLSSFATVMVIRAAFKLR